MFICLNPRAGMQAGSGHRCRGSRRQLARAPGGRAGAPAAAVRPAPGAASLRHSLLKAFKSLSVSGRKRRLWRPRRDTCRCSPPRSRCCLFAPIPPEEIFRSLPQRQKAQHTWRPRGGTCRCSPPRSRCTAAVPLPTLRVLKQPLSPSLRAAGSALHVALQGGCSSSVADMA